MNYTYKRITGGSLIATGLAIALLSAANAAGLHLGKILYSFSGGYTNGTDGAFATGDLIVDDAGIYYGTTSGGGGSLNCSGGCGTVYEVENGVESVIYVEATASTQRVVFCSTARAISMARPQVARSALVLCIRLRPMARKPSFILSLAHLPMEMVRMAV